MDNKPYDPECWDIEDQCWDTELGEDFPEGTNSNDEEE